MLVARLRWLRHAREQSLQGSLCSRRSHQLLPAPSELASRHCQGVAVQSRMQRARLLCSCICCNPRHEMPACWLLLSGHISRVRPTGSQPRPHTCQTYTQYESYHHTIMGPRSHSEHPLQAWAAGLMSCKMELGKIFRMQPENDMHQQQAGAACV